MTVLRAKPYTFAKLYILHMQNYYVLYKVYTFAYAKTYTCEKHIILHMQNIWFCITYEKLYILNKKRRAFHEEAPTTKIITDTAFVCLLICFCFCFVLFCFLRITTCSLLFLKCNMLRRGY